MKASYANWKARLAGEKVVTHIEPDENDCGFFRSPIKERKQNTAGQNNGQWKTIGFKPVALFVVDGALVCQIGAHLVDEDRRNDAWPHFSRNPITEEVWRAVVERGEPWPDFTPSAEPVPEGKTIAQMREENPNFDRDLERTFAMADAADEKKKAEPQIAIKQRLDALKIEVPKFAKVESDDQSSAGRGLQARFLELRGEAAGHYEQANRPLLEQQKALREIWFPIRDEADACKTEIGNALGGWEDTKRIAAKRAQEKADREAREHAEATRLAEEANQPPPPPPPVEKANLPPPSAQIKAPGVRAAKVTVKKIVTGIDLDKAFAQFRLAPEVSDVLFALAQRAVTAGLPVDGATIEERSKVS